MYNVEQIPSQFNEYKLSDSSCNSSAVVAVARGGILTSFVYNGIERIYMEEETYFNTDKKVNGGCPVLFPSCSKLKDGAYTLAGKTYEMGAHGIARDFPWTVVSTDTKDGAALTVALKSSEATRKSYPFDFEIEFTYILKGNVLRVEQKIKNLSDTDMPFVCGLHPYFMANTDKASVAVPSRLATYNGVEVAFDGVLDTREDLDHVCLNVSDTRAVLDTGLGYRVRVDYFGEYTCVVVWSPNKCKEFVCIEPWTAAPNALNTGKDLIYLAAGKDKTLINEFVIEE